MLRNVLILSASAGAGHLRAAQAIERALSLSGVPSVSHVDTLDYTTPLFREIYSRAYLDMVNRMPEVLGWLYDYQDRPGRTDPLGEAFERLNALPFVRLIQQAQPEIAVCTHFLPARIIAWLKASGRLATRQALVVTDFDLHAMWLCGNCEHYFVPLDETRAHLEELGIPAPDITVSGIPIDPAFAEPWDRHAIRAKHGLRRDGTVILISAGGFGVGNIEPLMTALSRLRHPAQIVAICGKNEELKARLEILAVELSAGSSVEIRVVGYTHAMHEYMAASDLIVGKPGGLTTSEALASNLIFVIVSPIPGQEERNADHLLEEGAAIRCNNLPVLAYKIDRLLDDPQRLETMRANVRRMARPRAAFDIAARLAELAEGDGHRP